MSIYPDTFQTRGSSHPFPRPCITGCGMQRAGLPQRESLAFSPKLLWLTGLVFIDFWKKFCFTTSLPSWTEYMGYYFSHDFKLAIANSTERRKFAISGVPSLDEQPPLRDSYECSLCYARAGQLLGQAPRCC